MSQNRRLHECRLKRTRCSAALLTSLGLGVLLFGGCSSPRAMPAKPAMPTTTPSDPISDLEVEWGFPEGKSPERLRLGRAVWNHDGKQLLVVLKDDRALYGQMDNVYVVDEGRHVVLTGDYYYENTFSPYGLIEIRSNDESLPLPYRNRWILAIEIWNSKENYDSALPVVPLQDWHATPPTNSVYVEPIQWDDIPQKFTNGVGRLAAVTNFEWRAAEAMDGATTNPATKDLLH